MKIGFIGGVEFSHALLSTILENGFDVKIVFSYDESKKSLYSDYALFDDLTKKYNIPLKKINNINESENIEIIKKIKPDLLLVMGWSQILKNEILRIPEIGVIGSHPTELPKYRGRAPIPWSIIKGLKQSALTLFYIDEGVDDGDILDQVKFSINDDDDASTLYKKMTEIGQSMIIKNLKLLETKSAVRTKQDESKFIENWNKRTPEDGLIDWSNTSEEIHRLIRASTHPYPGAFTFFRKTKITIWKASIENDRIETGLISKISHNGVQIGTGDGSILLKLVSVDNEKETRSSLIFSSSDLGCKIGK